MTTCPDEARKMQKAAWWWSNDRIKGTVKIEYRPTERGYEFVRIE